MLVNFSGCRCAAWRCHLSNLGKIVWQSATIDRRQAPATAALRGAGAARRLRYGCRSAASGGAFALSGVRTGGAAFMPGRNIAARGAGRMTGLPFVQLSCRCGAARHHLTVAQRVIMLLLRSP